MSDPARESQFRQMREATRSIFSQALDRASIAKGFARHVHCERGILRVCEDLYDLQAYSRVFAISSGKAGHTMVEALAEQVGSSLEGIVASSVEPASQVRGFRYFRGGHPTPNADSIQAASVMLRALEAQPASALVIFLISGGGSSIVEKPIDDEISLDDLIATYRALVHSGAPIAEINTDVWRNQRFPRSSCRCWCPTSPTRLPTHSLRDRLCPIPPRWKIAMRSLRNMTC
jgi:glycerate 2-kinase